MRQFSLLFVATEQHFLPPVCAPTHPYAESDGRPLRSAPRDGVDAIRISLVRLSENATAEFLSSFFSALPPLPQSFLQHAHSQNSYSSSQVASFSRCRGREEGVIHDLAVRPSASRLHDAQNCPACYRTVILPSLHDASSDTGAAAPLLVSCGHGYTLRGLAGMLGPFSSRPPLRAPRGFSVHLSLGCLSSAIIRPLLLSRHFGSPHGSLVPFS